MRTHIVTKLVCAGCGETLELTGKPILGKYSEGEPTGADQLSNDIGVNPCYTCTDPARKAAEAMKTFLGLLP